MARGESAEKRGMTLELLGYITTLPELKGLYHDDERYEQIVMMIGR
jgi:hypothetical protein